MLEAGSDLGPTRLVLLGGRTSQLPVSARSAKDAHADVLLALQTIRVGSFVDGAE